ncbi:MAG: hypothetical protein ACTSXK_06235 [Promethearchaeota archaeon]
MSQFSKYLFLFKNFKKLKHFIIILLIFLTLFFSESLIFIHEENIHFETLRNNSNPYFDDSVYFHSDFVLKDFDPQNDLDFTAKIEAENILSRDNFLFYDVSTHTKNENYTLRFISLPDNLSCLLKSYPNLFNLTSLDENYGNYTNLTFFGIENQNYNSLNLISANCINLSTIINHQENQTINYNISSIISSYNLNLIRSIFNPVSHSSNLLYLFANQNFLINLSKNDTMQNYIRSGIILLKISPLKCNLINKKLITTITSLSPNYFKSHSIMFNYYYSGGMHYRYSASSFFSQDLLLHLYYYIILGITIFFFFLIAKNELIVNLKHHEDFFNKIIAFGDDITFNESNIWALFLSKILLLFLSISFPLQILVGLVGNWYVLGTIAFCWPIYFRYIFPIFLIIIFTTILVYIKAYKSLDYFIQYNTLNSSKIRDFINKAQNSHLIRLINIITLVFLGIILSNLFLNSNQQNYLNTGKDLVDNYPFSIVILPILLLLFLSYFYKEFVLKLINGTLYHFCHEIFPVFSKKKNKKKWVISQQILAKRKDPGLNKSFIFYYLFFILISGSFLQAQSQYYTHFNNLYIKDDFHLTIAINSNDDIPIIQNFIANQSFSNVSYLYEVQLVQKSNNQQFKAFYLPNQNHYLQSLQSDADLQKLNLNKSSGVILNDYRRALFPSDYLNVRDMDGSNYFQLPILGSAPSFPGAFTPLKQFNENSAIFWGKITTITNLTVQNLHILLTFNNSIKDFPSELLSSFLLEHSLTLTEFLQKDTINSPLPLSQLNPFLLPIFISGIILYSISFFRESKSQKKKLTKDSLLLLNYIGMDFTKYSNKQIKIDVLYIILFGIFDFIGIVLIIEILLNLITLKFLLLTPFKIQLFPIPIYLIAISITNIIYQIIINSWIIQKEAKILSK